MYTKRIHLLIAAALMVESGSAGAADKADHVVVVKSSKTLTLFKGTQVLGTYPVVFGPQPVGPKQRQGDEHTPEGHYILDFKKSDSAFHKAIHISYPNEQDIERAKELGVPPGGSIMLHGQKNHSRWSPSIAQSFNWTNGCVALTNEDMDAVWKAVDAGTPIEIEP